MDTYKVKQAEQAKPQQEKAPAAAKQEIPKPE